MQEPTFLALSFFAPYLRFSLNLQVNSSGILASEKWALRTELPNAGFTRSTIQPKVNWNLLLLIQHGVQRYKNNTGGSVHRSDPNGLSVQLNLLIPFISLVLHSSQGVCVRWPTATSQRPETQTGERRAHVDTLLPGWLFSKELSWDPGSCCLVALPQFGSQITLCYSSQKKKKRIWSIRAVQAWAWFPPLAPFHSQDLSYRE